MRHIDDIVLRRTKPVQFVLPWLYRGNEVSSEDDAQETIAYTLQLAAASIKSLEGGL
jgi:hypothetical protein